MPQQNKEKEMPRATKVARGINDALGRETPEESEDGMIAYCPVHETKGDHTPSLVVFREENGVCNVHCRSGCRPARVKQAIRDLIGNDALGKSTKSGSKFDLVREHLWRSVDEKWAIRHTKMLVKEGSTVKTTFFWKYAPWALRETPGYDKCWSKGMPHKDGHGSEALPVPYGAYAGAGELLLVEGEKDCDAAVALGFDATTPYDGGGTSWAEAYLEVVAGRDVVIVPDNDPTGEVFASAALATFWEVARSLRVLVLPDLPDKGDLFDWVESGGSHDELATLIEGCAIATEPEFQLSTVSDVEDMLVYNKDGGLLPTQRNFELLLSDCKELASYAYDTFSDEPIELSSMRLVEKGELLHAAHCALSARYEKQVPLKEGLSVVYRALRQVNLPARWLASLPDWDGVRRIPHMLRTYFGAVGDASYLSVCAQIQMIGMVERMLLPGFKHDTMVILDGPQGIGKSMALAALAPGGEGDGLRKRLYCEHNGTRFGTDQVRDMIGKVMVEVAEKSIFEKADRAEDLKATISREVDRIAKKYRDAVDYPRTWVAWGTVNGAVELFHDLTGNRRFPLVHVVGADAVAIRDDHSQLWAEALWRRNEGQKNYVTTPEIGLLMAGVQRSAARIDWELHEQLLVYMMRDWEQKPGQSPTQKDRKSCRKYLWNADFYAWYTGGDAKIAPIELKRELKKLRIYYEMTSAESRKLVENGKSSTSIYMVSDMLREDAEQFHGGGGDDGGGKPENHIKKMVYHTEKEKNKSSDAVVAPQETSKNHKTIKYLYTLHKNSVSTYPRHVYKGFEQKTGNFMVIGLDIETAGTRPWLDGRVRTVQVSDGETTVIADLDHGEMPALDSAAHYVVHNGTFEASWLRDLELQYEDTMLMAKSLEAQALPDGERQPKYDLASVAKRWLDIDMDKSLQGPENWEGELTEAHIRYAGTDALVAVQLFNVLKAEMDEGMWRGYEIQRDAIAATAGMECEGMFLDTEGHQKLIEKFTRQRDEAVAWFHVEHAELVAEPSKIVLSRNSQYPDTMAALNSGKVLSEYIQERVNRVELRACRWAKSRKSGLLSMAKPTLKRVKELTQDHDIVEFIEHKWLYTQADKLLSSFGVSLQEKAVAGRLHGSFNLMGAATGRMSSSNPNLQNMPNNNDFRNLFRAPEGRKLVISDYSQVEVRVAGLLANEPVIAEMFINGHDAHRASAALMYQVQYEEVTTEQRKKAKAVTFGILYGMGAAKLADTIGVSEDEANGELAKWRHAFPVLAQWREDMLATAMRNKEIRMASGRRVLVTDQTSPSQVYNYPVQGSAADVLLASLASLHSNLPIGAVVVGAVHDEFIVECSPEVAEESARVMKQSMQAGLLAVFPDAGLDNLCDVSVTDRWAEKD